MQLEVSATWFGRGLGNCFDRSIEVVVGGFRASWWGTLHDVRHGTIHTCSACMS